MLCRKKRDFQTISVKITIITPWLSLIQVTDVFPEIFCPVCIREYITIVLIAPKFAEVLSYMYYLCLLEFIRFNK